MSMTNEYKLEGSIFTRNDSYVQFLLNRRSRVFYLKPWGGNSGDVLIWLGTEHLLRDLHISRTLDPREADVILLPGGNQTMWQANIDVWKEVWARWPKKEFVVGPTTVQLGFTTWRKDVDESGANVTGIFARDLESYATLRQCGLSDHITLGLSHDPALYLWDSDLIRTHRKASTEEFVLAAFRMDHEAAVNPLEKRTRWENLLPAGALRRIRSRRERLHRQEKIALVTRYTRRSEPVEYRDASQYLFEYFLEIVRSASEVHTDRLHCMLMAIMLGKPTFVYPTAYGKLEAIYAHSLQGRAPVEFVEGTRPVPNVGVKRSVQSREHIVQA
jgi:exopolysaccharide biosynthesis predicted pyruvyltransferase EpsI